jgi:hypothetical protein
MDISARDMNVLRRLAGRYSETAHREIQADRVDRYVRSNSLEVVRPVVLIDEVPWGEIRDETLVNVCTPELHWIEGAMRRALYQWDHFQADMVILSVFHVRKAIRSTGIGVQVHEQVIKGDTGAYIASHEYTDQLATDDDLEKLRLPEISYAADTTEKAYTQASRVFDGLMPVKLSGHYVAYNIWDRISTLRGVDSLLLDLAMRPDFMHRTARRFMEIAEAMFRQYEELGLLDPEQTLLHCTPGLTRDLPAADFAGQVRRKDVWGRCSAQIFSAVSPQMHDEFDLAYNQQLFGGCGLVYYGCCEPMDAKIDILRNRFPNLRKISITPWADPERAARNIGTDYVLAAKPNPAFVANTTFNPEPVEREITRYCEVCRECGTPVEFVIKDISTIANNPDNLTQWADTVNRTLDRFYR